MHRQMDERTYREIGKWTEGERKVKKKEKREEKNKTARRKGRKNLNSYQGLARRQNK